MQRIRTRTFFILLVMVNLTVSFIAAQSWAETPVIGFVAQDTTWTQANSPYVTMGNIIVKEGVTLTIEPGVTVQFDSGHSLTIEGTLIARGTDTQSTVFTSKENKEPGQWDGIVFRGTDVTFDDAGNYVSGSILQYSTIEFATTGVRADDGSFLVDYCTIRSNNSEGILVSNGNIIIQNSAVLDNKPEIVYYGSPFVYGKGGGIHVEGGDITISNNTLAGNSITQDGVLGSPYWGMEYVDSKGGGIYVEGGNVIIKNNTLAENMTKGNYGGKDIKGGEGKGGGIYITNGTVTINNNILIGNIAIGGNPTDAPGGDTDAPIGDSKGGGIYVEGGNVIIKNNTLAENIATGGSGAGIYVSSVDDDTAVTISNNALTGNTAEYGSSIYVGGVYVGRTFVVRGAVTISDNTITENHISGSDGAAIYYSGSQEITGNFIANNVAGGYRNNVVYIKGNPTFTGNTIIGNQTKYNLYYAQEKGSPNLDATNNYWGLTNEAEIRLTIYDFFIDNSKAVVDVSPFLVENPLPMGSLTVAVSPKALPADGVSTATITVTLKDSKGNPVVDESLTVIVSQGTGRLSEVKNNKDGTYTATYTASRTEGSEIIWVAAPNSRLAKSIEIQLTEPGTLPPKTLTIPDTEATAGGTADIPVVIDDITGVAKAEIVLGYDANFLEMQDVSGTDLIEGLNLTTAVLAGKIFLEGAKGLAGGSGAMFHVTFKIAKDAPVGETEIKFESIALYDEAGTEIPSTGTSGKLSVKEYQPLSSFTLSLDEGINIVSLPVQPQTPFTARSFAENLDATMVISYDGKQGGFIAFVPEVFKEDGFSIEGGRGYIVNLLESKEVSFTGTVWSNAPSSISVSPSKKDSHWAFVVAGLISTEPDLKEPLSELRVTVKNQRTEQLSQCALTDDMGEFATAFVDMSRKSVIKAGDMLEITVRNSRGELVSVPVVQEVSETDLTKATVVANLRLGEVIPSQSQLFQNYPNPFNPETWIPFQLAESAEVTIRIYNVAGQLVRTLNLGQKTAGRYLDKTRAAYWDGRNEQNEKISSGVYFYLIEAGNFRATKKLVVAK